MKLNCKAKSIIIEVVCLLYIALFVYAAISKLLDFGNFQVQLGQSPLLSIYALWISWLVIGIELTIALLLVFPKSRIVGLYAALSLMTMFTIYIFIILHFSSFIPCSCGGILEKMSWNAHLIFNGIFVLLAVLSIVLSEKIVTGKISFRTIKSTSGVIFLSVLTIVVLFLSSEQIMHHSNPFIRRYPNHPVEFSNTIDLKHHSYYFAGFANKRIYLGNYQYPTYILSVDQKLSHKKLEKIHFDPTKIPFHLITISIQNPYFYLSDGGVPAVLRGDLKNWTITKEFKGLPYFTRAVPIDGIRLAFRSNNSKKLANVLGVYNSDSIPKIKYNRELLQRQIDGIFDTDGTLLYSEGEKKIVYLYYYRNEFVVANKTGKLVNRGHTIDTISRAQLKVSSLNDGKQFAMSSPSFVVNANAAVFKNLLFVQSTVKGRYENDKLWERSFIIDVYNLKSNTYVLSFPLYHTSSNVLNSLEITDTHLYAIIGNDLVVYELKKIIKQELK